MNDVNFSHMTMPQLVAFYNRHSAAPVKRFADRNTAESRCAALFKSLLSSSAKVLHQRAPQSETDGAAVLRPAMRASLRLHREIMCVDTGETWKNPYRMWQSHPDWLSGGQLDRLTAQLYAAAKLGQQKTLTINARSFRLVRVEMPA